MPRSENEEMESLLASILPSDSGVLYSCLVSSCYGEGTCVKVEARCILGSCNICGTNKNKIELVVYHDMYSLVWTKGHITSNPFNFMSRLLFHTFIHYACLLTQF